MILIKPFLDETPSIFIGSSSLLKSSITDIFKFNSSKATNVSPANGALLIMESFSIETLAFGKLLNKLKSASLKATLASTLSLIDFKILALIWSSNKYGIANADTTSNNKTIPTIFKIFFTMTIEFIFKFQKQKPCPEFLFCKFNVL